MLRISRILFNNSFQNYAYFLFFSLLIIVNLNSSGQTIFRGRVLDIVTGLPVINAEVSVKGKNIKSLTDINGQFSIITDTNDPSKDNYYILISNSRIYWNVDIKTKLSLYNSVGQNTGMNIALPVGTGETTLPSFPSGVYFLQINDGKKISTLKFIHDNNNNSAIFNAIHYNNNDTKKKALLSPDSIEINKSSYYAQIYPLKAEYSDYNIMQKSYSGSIDYFSNLIRIEAFKLMQSEPLSSNLGEMKSVKIVYSFTDDKIYYTNSEKYFIHYDFALKKLDYKKGHYTFNIEQYTDNPERLYYLGTINHLESSDIYTLEFFAGDELTCLQIEQLYNKIIKTSYLERKIKFYANNTNWSLCNNIPTISSDELYKGQNYQALNPQEGYGYLRKFTATDLKTQYAGRHDIVLLNTIPNDITAVAGIITTEFQTPLSHINVLSHNRGTPNMALRDGWTNPIFEDLNNKLIYLKVTRDSFIVKEATLAEAQAFWSQKEPSEIKKLHHDTITSGLINLSNVNYNADTLVGGKAANFAELKIINSTSTHPFALPEGDFAIPFFYYWQHIHTNGINKLIAKMLKDSLFWSNFQYRQQQLQHLRDTIIACPIDQTLLQLVNNKIKATGSSFFNIRFRSSTNSEDIKGFNGAGLYDSFTGIPGDTKKSIDKAIKRVWASLWNLAAFEEREYYKIDHQTVSMAILAHRSFPTEEANGVVITENLYSPYNAAYTINVQQGELSITNPEGDYLPDQIIFYLFVNTIEYISHSNVPGMEGRTVLTDSEIQELALYCNQIHSHYCLLNLQCNAMDIEFKVDMINSKRKLYIKQARYY